VARSPDRDNRATVGLQRSWETLQVGPVGRSGDRSTTIFPESRKVI
jgi:hypothetical protein